MRMSYPFNAEDPFQRYEEREPSAFEIKNKNEYCIYLRDRVTGELVYICDSDLPF